MKIEKVFNALDAKHWGLSQEEYEERIAQHGANEIIFEKRVTPLKILWAQLWNPLVGVLLLAAIISLLAGKQIDTLVIAVVIILNTLIGFFQEFKAERAVEALRDSTAPEAKILRNYPDIKECRETQIPAKNVVPGDVILLVAGDKVPADARLFEAYNLEVDEAMLTGESTTVSKHSEPLKAELSTGDRLNLVYGGTIITQGRGKAVVYATGKQTELGKIARLIEETETTETPLRKQVFELTKKLGLLTVIVVVAIIGLGLLRGLKLLDVFLFALAGAVSSIPEGLPAVLTITLAVGVNRMARNNAIIRKLHAVDTLGAATVIVTDKTGTLTTNQMTVKEIFGSGKLTKVGGVGFKPTGNFTQNDEKINPNDQPDLLFTLEAAALCNDAQLIEHIHNGKKEWEAAGDPTETALLVAAAKSGHQRQNLVQEKPRIDEIPFSSEKKFMTTFHKALEGATLAFVKGAPEVVLNLCNQVRMNENDLPLTDKDKEAFEGENHRMASAGMRVLAIAYRPIKDNQTKKIKAEIENGNPGLVFLGLMGMIDPPRPEVPATINRCHRANIRVIMATGDHQLTAEAIAHEVGIIKGGEKVITGVQLDEMDDPTLDNIINSTAVFARVSPTHKHRIVESLRRNGHIVAMTGDGVNDAPALKAAEIGVAMGITGTDVTKETAEMILTDDNFASIVEAIEQGRVVFQNVRKVVKFLLATNIGENLVILSSLAFLPVAGLIFTPVQILWVNLVTDGLLDIAIAMEPKEGDVMDKKPRPLNARIINKDIIFNIIFVAIFMAVGTLFIYSTANPTQNGIYASTMGFTTLAMFQVFNAFNVRSRHTSIFKLGFFSNPWLIGAIVLSIILQILATRLPFLQTALGTVSLNWQDWAKITVVASTVFVAQELRKLVAGMIRNHKTRSA